MNSPVPGGLHERAFSASLKRRPLLSARFALLMKQSKVIQACLHAECSVGTTTAAATIAATAKAHYEKHPQDERFRIASDNAAKLAATAVTNATEAAASMRSGRGCGGNPEMRELEALITDAEKEDMYGAAVISLRKQLKVMKTRGTRHELAVLFIEVGLSIKLLELREAEQFPVQTRILQSLQPVQYGVIENKSSIKKHPKKIKPPKKKKHSYLAQRLTEGIERLTTHDSANAKLMERFPNGDDGNNDEDDGLMGGLMIKVRSPDEGGDGVPMKVRTSSGGDKDYGELKEEEEEEEEEDGLPSLGHLAETGVSDEMDLLRQTPTYKSNRNMDRIMSLDDNPLEVDIDDDNSSSSSSSDDDDSSSDSELVESSSSSEDDVPTKSPSLLSPTDSSLCLLSPKGSFKGSFNSLTEMITKATISPRSNNIPHIASNVWGSVTETRVSSDEVIESTQNNPLSVDNVMEKESRASPSSRESRENQETPQINRESSKTSRDSRESRKGGKGRGRGRGKGKGKGSAVTDNLASARTYSSSDDSGKGKGRVRKASPPRPPALKSSGNETITT